jgi:hypothetical protein
MLRAIQNQLDDTVSQVWKMLEKLTQRGKTLNDLEHDAECVSESSSDFLEQIKHKNRPCHYRLMTLFKFYIWCYCCDRNKIHKYKRGVK